MFQLDQDGITRSRQGYVFSYAQITFNQFRRYANVQMAMEDQSKEMETLQKRIAAGDLPTGAEMAPKGWRSFTMQFELEAEQLECKILAALSCALFLEAYIYDYCARKESGSFAQKYTDRLDPVAKWVLIPRLIVPPGLDTGDSVFERMRKLFRLRNELVHHKTKESSDFSAPPVFPSDLLPGDCARLIWDALQLLQKADPLDEFGAFVLRHIASWANYAGKDSSFYPILWEA